MRRSDSDCASAGFFRRVAAGSCRARRRVSGPGRRGSVSVAGRSVVLRRERCGPALLRMAPTMQLACRRLRRPRRVLRHGPAASCAATMASRVSFRKRGECLPGPATASVAATASASIKDSCFVPSCAASRQTVSRGCRAAALDARAAGAYGPAHGSSDSPPRPTERVTYPCLMPVHLPGHSGMR